MKNKNRLALASIAVLIIAVILYKWPSKSVSEPQATPQKLEYSREVLPKNPEILEENNITNMENLNASISGAMMPKDLQEE